MIRKYNTTINYTVYDIAVMLSVSTKSVREWIGKNWILSHKVGRTSYVKEDYFECWRHGDYIKIRSGTFKL